MSYLELVYIFTAFWIYLKYLANLNVCVISQIQVVFVRVGVSVSVSLRKREGVNIFWLLVYPKTFP